MSQASKTTPSLTLHLRKLRGGSQPVLAQASDGCFYVVKFANNLQGPNVLFNEAMGTELYSHSELTVPSWTPLLATRDFIDGNPACWIQAEREHVRPQVGLCFGSRLVGCVGYRLFEILDRGRLQRLTDRDDFWLAWLLDICGGHCDHRQAIFKANLNGRLSSVFIDHSHMFAGPSGSHRLGIGVSRYLDSRIYPALSLKRATQLYSTVIGMHSDAVRDRLRDLPDEWKTESAVSRFEECLQALSTGRVVEETIEIMLNAHSLSIPSMNGATDEAGHRWDQHASIHPGSMAPGGDTLSRQVGVRGSWRS